ncbi:MAG: hypothetical protein ACI4JN_08315, partial [Ruminococcus sp.]
MRNLFLRYLYEKRKSFAVFGAFLIIFMIVFALYDIPLEAALYAGSLCGVLGLIVIMFSYAGFRKRSFERRHLLKNILLSTEEMPEPVTAAEEDYIRMIEKLRTAAGESARRYDLERTESIE